MPKSPAVHVTAALAGLVLVGAACGACGGGDPATPSGSEDERGSIGVPPPADAYCTKLGFTVVDAKCTFPDGTSCDVWAFYRGECGQPHSYCNQHGGTVSSKTEDNGGFTSVYAVCDVNGKQCKESSFSETGKCE